MIFDGIARFSRQNLGGVYEPYLNASKRDLLVEIKELLDIKYDGTPVNPEYIRKHPNFDYCKARLLRWYEIVVPHVHQWFITGAYRKPFEEHLKAVIEEGVIRIHFPPDNQAYGPEMAARLREEFKTVYGPVTYIGNSGKVRKTKNKVRIGSMYIIILEKTGDDWTAVSSGKFQNFGVLAPITSRDKYTSPTRNQAIRAFGDAEVRILITSIGPLSTAEIMDRNNNIPTHREICRSILMSMRPSHIDVAVDRNKHPLGNARPLQLVKHLAQCGGFEFQYTPYVPGNTSNQMETEEA
jgi:putative transposon-encoded protein